MVSGISGSSSIQYQSISDTSNTLTDDQKETLTSILSNYDSENMTAESMQKMMDEIKEAGITPSKDLRDALDEAGFKPPEKPQGPPPDEASGKTEIPGYLQDFLEKQANGEVTQDDIDSLVASLQSSGQTTVGTIVDQKS